MNVSSRLQSLLNTLTIMVTVVGLGADHASAQQSSVTLELTNGAVSPDGITRDAILVNGALFGAVITGKKGDHFVIEVDNQLNNTDLRKSTSIHWHGLFQRGSSWADGPAFVTQCPIAPDHKFTYQFTPTEEAGTFWYHSHLDAQYCDGLRGPFIIYDPEDPHLDLYDADNDTPAPQLSGIITPDSTLINGLGRTVATPTAPLAVINVQQGLRYRFRLLSLSCDPNWVFSIEGHDLTVVEADGVSMQPVTVSSIQIFAAQRYSFILNANQPVDNYWIRANPNIGPTGFNNNINSAILRYQGAPVAEPTGLGVQDTLDLLFEPDLHPVVNPGAPGVAQSNGVDIDLVISIAFTSGRFFLDGTSYTSPDMPSLLQILSGTPASDLLSPGSYIPLPANKTIQISFPVIAGQGSAVGAPHPFHLHGHTFDVVRSAGSSVYNYIDPPRRDVVAIGLPGDNVTIRFVTDNAGPWFLHCHIEWHLRNGLGVVIAEDTAGVVNGPAPPQEWEELCDIYNALDPEDQ